MTKGVELVERLREMCVDWDGSGMKDAETPRIEPTCGDLREAAATIEHAATALSSAQERIAELEGALAEAERLNNKYAWERDKAREERDTAEARAEAFWKDYARRSRTTEKMDG